MSNFETRRNALASANNQKVGSYIAVVGDLEKEGESCEEAEDFKLYVIINGCRYKIDSNSIVDAIDYCYKSFASLHADFSYECKHLWVFLQSYIYKNSLHDMRSYTVVAKFVDELDKLRNSS